MKIGIVGLGSIGKRHAINATKLGHDVHIYDPVVKGDFRFRYERDLYDWCDAAVIATPSQFHESGLRACVERGKHVLIEKPISVAIGALPELLRVAADKKLVVMMGNNLRMHPCVQETKMWLDAGRVGIPIWASFTCAQLSKKYTEDGVVLNTGAHEVDLALHLLGPAEVVYANARFKRHRAPDADDIVDFMLFHQNGCRSTFHLDFVTPCPIREFRISGDDGSIYCDLIDRSMLRYQPNPKLPDINHEELYLADTGSWNTDYLDEMRAFFDRIDGQIVPGATGEDGFATLDLLIDVRRKAGLE